MKSVIFASLWFITLTAHGEVTRVSEGSFVSQHQLSIAAPTDVVWRGLTQNLAQWWNAAHSYSGDAANFQLDARPGGCFCEELPDGGVEHMRVVFVRENLELRMSGGLGPLQAMGVAGAMSFVLKSAEAGSTLLDYKYSVTGAGGESLASAVDRVQLDQLERLKRYAETGDATDHLRTETQR